jgi:uncharacterized membrane protein
MTAIQRWATGVEAPAMAEREITERERIWLTGELAYWHAVGLLSEDQAGRITALYGTAAEVAGQRTARALQVLASLAALLVGLGVLLLVGYNWEALPAAIKLVLLFGTLLGTHAVGFALRFRYQKRTASEVAFFLACLFDGAAIALVAQIFHINSDNPDGFWWWAVCVLPFALVLDTMLLHTLYVGLLAFFAGYSVFSFAANVGAGRFVLFPPYAAYSVPILALPGILWAYRKKSPMTVALYAPLLAWWLILLPFAWKFEANPIYFIGCVGALFLIIAESHAEGSEMAIPYRYYGMLLTAGVLLPLSYYAFNRETVGRSSFPVGMLVVMVAAAVAAVLVAVIGGERERWSLASKDAGSRLVNLVVATRRSWLPLGLTLYFVVLALWHMLLEEPLIPTVLSNVAMIALAVWLLQLGLRENRGRPFAAGVLYFLLWAVLRYIDLFGDFGGMVGAALLFFLCGAALFGVVVYWRRRTEVRHAGG